MKFYKGVKKGKFYGKIGKFSTLAELKELDNSAVCKYSDLLSIDNVLISQQNKKGFVSVKHIKDEFYDIAKAKWEREVRSGANRYIEDLLRKHRTTIHRVHKVLRNYECGRMFTTNKQAEDVIEENESNGLNWWIFKDYAIRFPTEYLYKWQELRSYNSK